MKKDVKSINEWYDENKYKHKNLFKKAQNIIEELIRTEEIQINSISGRVKNKDSFCEKALKDKYEDPLNEIKDIIGIRIITYVNSDIERISRLIEREFHVDSENSVDKGKLLGIDKVGYKSVHYIVKLTDARTSLSEYKDFKDVHMEIQIRTLLQHAWSEIEHDRNYKFSGVLPADIKRKFSLLAGTLELVDMQFEEISKQIDEYAEVISEKVEDGDLKNILIDSTSIKEYLSKRFKDRIENKLLSPTLKSSEYEEKIIDELNKFGIYTIAELEELLKIEIDFNGDEGTNFIGMLRHYMMINDAEKYFGKCWEYKQAKLTRQRIHMLKKNNVNIEKILDTYNITAAIIEE